jgi:hypothetical protein
MEFVPESGPQAYDIPFFEDVKAEDGWEGQGSGKTEAQLEKEVIQAIALLQGGVTSIVHGTFNDGHHTRDGYRLDFVITRDNGTADRARIDIAALPCRRPDANPKGTKGLTNRKRSIRMALYMLRNALKGMWFMRQLAPGFVPLMPFLLAKDSDGNERTLSELYGAKGMFSKLLPAPQADFIEGEVIKIS